jgi:hypothetical protein
MEARIRIERLSNILWPLTMNGKATFRRRDGDTDECDFINFSSSSSQWSELNVNWEDVALIRLDRNVISVGARVVVIFSDEQEALTAWQSLKEHFETNE